MVVYENPYIFTPVVKAWAFWVGTIQGFSNMIGSWRGSAPRCKESLLNNNKKLSFTHELAYRLDLTQIENKDAVELIKRLDTPETFFYVDPPYVGADQGHYGGYTQEHFSVLLEGLKNIKGKFLLSSYPNKQLNEYREENKWYSNDVEMQLSVSSSSRKRKIECLTFNYCLN
jgi:DNA adenine methylase